MIGSIKKHWRVYRKFFVTYFKIKLIYKTDFVIGLMNQALSMLSSLAFIGLIFTQVESLNGWSLYQMILLYSYFRFVLNLHTFFFFAPVFLDEEYILNGRLDRFRVRPINVLYQVYASKLNLHNLGDCIASLAILFIAAGKLSINILTPQNLLYGFFSVISSIIVIMAIFLLVSSIAFWTGRSQSIFTLVWRVRGFSRFPLSIYPGAMKAFLMTLMPIAFASFFPVTFLLGMDYLRFQLLSLIAGPFFFFLAYQFWKIGLSRYSSTGS